MAAGGDVPHDLATFVIEEVLGIEHGFWGCVAGGATFRALGRRRTSEGRAVIDRHFDELDLAERRVNEVFFAWRRGEGTPADGALDHALYEWRSLLEGGEMVRVWRVTSASGSRAARTRPRAR